MGALKALWAGWTVIARKIGDFQARVLLSVFYFGAVAPLALGVKLLGEPLDATPGGRPGWLVREDPIGDPVAVARRQS